MRTTRAAAHGSGLAHRLEHGRHELAVGRPGAIRLYVDGRLHAHGAGPHRNEDGNRAAFDLLLGDDATARRVIAEKGIDYVAICPGAPEHFNYARAAPVGLSARLGRDEVPDYLEALPDNAKATLRVFRVRPEAFLRGTQAR